MTPMTLSGIGAIQPILKTSANAHQSRTKALVVVATRSQLLRLWSLLSQFLMTQHLSNTLRNNASAALRLMVMAAVMEVTTKIVGITSKQMLSKLKPITLTATAHTTTVSLAPALLILNLEWLKRTQRLTSLWARQMTKSLLESRDNLARSQLMPHSLFSRTTQEVSLPMPQLAEHLLTMPSSL